MQEEIFPLVDEFGTVIGQASRSICHNGSMLLHPVIHLHIFNNKGELYLQKRSANKDVQPNKWDSSVAGHIDVGETPEIAVLREAEEELGILNISPEYITKYIIKTDTEQELSCCFYAVYNGPFRINEEELADGKFWELKEIESLLDQDIFTPNFELDFKKFLHLGLNDLIQERNLNSI